MHVELPAPPPMLSPVSITMTVGESRMTMAIDSASALMNAVTTVPSSVQDISLQWSDGTVSTWSSPPAAEPPAAPQKPRKRSRAKPSASRDTVARQLMFEDMLPRELATEAVTAYRNANLVTAKTAWPPVPLLGSHTAVVVHWVDEAAFRFELIGGLRGNNMPEEAELVRTAPTELLPRFLELLTNKPMLLMGNVEPALVARKGDTLLDNSLYARAAPDVYHVHANNILVYASSTSKGVPYVLGMGYTLGPVLFNPPPPDPKRIPHGLDIIAPAVLLTTFGGEQNPFVLTGNTADGWWSERRKSFAALKAPERPMISHQFVIRLRRSLPTEVWTEMTKNEQCKALVRHLVTHPAAGMARCLEPVLRGATVQCPVFSSETPEYPVFLNRILSA